MTKKEIIEFWELILAPELEKMKKMINYMLILGSMITIICIFQINTIYQLVWVLIPLTIGVICLREDRRLEKIQLFFNSQEFLKVQEMMNTYLKDSWEIREKKKLKRELNLNSHEGEREKTKKKIRRINNWSAMIKKL